MSQQAMKRIWVVALITCQGLAYWLGNELSEMPRETQDITNAVALTMAILAVATTIVLVDVSKRPYVNYTYALAASITVTTLALLRAGATKEFSMVLIALFLGAFTIELAIQRVESCKNKRRE